MKNKLTTFQIVLFAVSILLIVGGVAFFALKRAGPGSQLVEVKVWGTIDSNLITEYQEQINRLKRDSIKLDYKQFPKSVFERELINALASGQGPDVVIFPDDLLVKHDDKLFNINYEYYPQAEFKNNFIEGAEFLIKNEGLSGIPFIVDPLVLYWNRTTLNSNGISNPPQFWDEFLDLTNQLTRRDTSANVSKATIALGEFVNVRNASDILTTLILQAGNPIIVRGENGYFNSIFNERLGYSVAPADAAIGFFTQFSNPTKQTYTWNRALPMSDEMFLAGDLAFYIGFASERNSLIERNPNLNFGVTQLPQSRSGVEDNRKATGAKMQFLAILNLSNNIAASFDAIYKMTNTENMQIWQEITGLPPVRRNLLSSVPEIDYLDVFNKSSLIARPFLEPDPDKTDQAFRNSVDSLTSGRFSISETVNRIEQDLTLLLNE